jgi:hypothetical protein
MDTDTDPDWQALDADPDLAKGCRSDPDSNPDPQLVFRIRNMFVRIRILRSILLTNGSRSYQTIFFLKIIPYR